MKNEKKFLFSAVGLFLLLFFTNCEKNQVTYNPELNTGKTILSGGPEDCPPTTNTFIAGQNINVGTITTFNTPSELIIEISLTNNWVMGMTHLYVGSKENMPKTKKGNPKIGKFPYKIEHNPMVNYYVFTIPLSEIDEECYTIALHAEVHHLDENGNIDQSETAWADGNPIHENGNCSWAMYYDYCTCYPTYKE